MDTRLSEPYDVAAMFAGQADIVGISTPPHAYRDVPGWASLEFFLRGSLGVTGDRAIDTFRKFYNHYLRRFPVHYFTEDTIPGVDFALFFPVQVNVGGKSKSHYLVAVSEKDKRLVLFHQSLWSSLKTRENFYRQMNRWLEKGYSHSKIDGYDVTEILAVCEKPEELLALRQKRFYGFLDHLQRKLRKLRQERHFEGKWEAIRKFLEERDRHYIHLIADKLKSEHISLDVAQRAAATAANSLDIYNWIMAARDETTIQRRMQLTEYLPWLATALADQNIAPEYIDIEKAIDDGERLIPVLQEFFSPQNGTTPVSQATIRKMLKLQIDPSILRPRDLREVVQQVDKHWSYMTIEKGLLERLHAGEESSRGGLDYLRSSFTEAVAHAPETIRAAMLKDTQSYRKIREYNDAADFMQQVYARLVLPYFARRAHEIGKEGLDPIIVKYLRGSLWRDIRGSERPESYVERAAKQYLQPPALRPFGNAHVYSIVELSRLWHAKRPIYDGRMRGVNVDKELQWPALSPVVRAPEGIILTPLVSKDDLMMEHKEMLHCIADYSGQCLGLVEYDGAPRTYSHILKMQSANGKERATMEVLEPYYADRGAPRHVKMGGMDGKRKQIDVKNPPPPDSPLIPAAQWYVDQINDGKIKVDWAAVDKQRAAARTGRPLSDLAIEVGFDFTDKEKCAEAYRAMRPYLPVRYHYYDYDEWIEKMGFRHEADVFFQPEGSPLSIKDLARFEYRLKVA